MSPIFSNLIYDPRLNKIETEMAETLIKRTNMYVCIYFPLGRDMGSV